MAAVATREPVAAAREDGSPQPRASRLFEPHGPTLEELILERWDALVVDGRAECPVCNGSMSAAGGCESCGSELR